MSVIIDAVSAKPEERRAFAALAKDVGVPFDGIWLEAPADVLRSRVGARTNDASDADLAVLEKQLGYDLGVVDWHRIDASEVWVHSEGAPLELSVSDGSGPGDVVTIGDGLPQFVVPPGMWQSASSTGDWSLAVCVVVPAFEWEGFELAPPGWGPVS